MKKENTKKYEKHYDHKDVILLVSGAFATTLLIFASFFSIQNNNLKYYLNQTKTNSVQEKVNESDINQNIEIVNTGDTTDWKTYTNEKYGFEIKYPKNYQSARPYVPSYRLDNPIYMLSANQTRYEDIGVNLHSNVGISYSNDLNKCSIYQKGNGSEVSFSKTANVGNENFQYIEDGGVATGNNYESSVYRTIHNNLCFEIELTNHTSSDWNNVDDNDYATLTAKKESAKMEMDQIFSTFRFTDESVKGASTDSVSCLARFGDIMSEISQCEDMDELTCFYYKGIFDKCNESCLEDASKEECLRICMPVCE